MIIFTVFLFTTVNYNVVFVWLWFFTNKRNIFPRFLFSFWISSQILCFWRSSSCCRMILTILYSIPPCRWVLISTYTWEGQLRWGINGNWDSTGAQHCKKGVMKIWHCIMNFIHTDTPLVQMLKILQRRYFSTYFLGGYIFLITLLSPVISLLPCVHCTVNNGESLSLYPICRRWVLLIGIEGLCYWYR